MGDRPTFAKSSISETSYSKGSGTVSNRLQSIFHQNKDDFEEPYEDPPNRYKRRTDVLDADRLDDYIDREDTR